jgi:hypothetical protein
MAPPTDQSLMSLSRRFLASEPFLEELDVAAEMEALRARRLALHEDEEADKPFNMERFFQLMEQKPPATPVNDSSVECREVQLNELKKLSKAKLVKRTDVEMYFAGTAKLMGLKQAFLHQDPTPEKIHAETRAAAEAVADKIRIYELERRVEALQNQIAQGQLKEEAE